MEDRIEQCQSPDCTNALVDGYVEMADPLTGIRSRICFPCARENLKIKRLLEEDDALRSGTAKHPEGLED